MARSSDVNRVSGCCNLDSLCNRLSLIAIHPDLLVLVVLLARPTVMIVSVGVGDCGERRECAKHRS